MIYNCIAQVEMDARERLLSEMEERARERADTAEAEAVRLKGILTHMEVLVQGLKSQTADEKERLRGEHARLQMLQVSLEETRVAQARRVTEEAEILKERSRQLHADREAWVRERQMQLQEMDDLRERLAREKATHETHITTTSHSLELRLASLKEEEVRLKRLSDETLEQAKQSEQRHLRASHNLISKPHFSSSLT